MRHLDSDTLKAVLIPIYEIEQKKGLLDKFDFLTRKRK